MALIDVARVTNAAVDENLMGETKQKQHLSRVESLEAQSAYLTARLGIIEGILSKAVGLEPAQLKELIDAKMPRVEARKTTEELKLETVPCPQCKRSVHRSLKNCQICGASLK